MNNSQNDKMCTISSNAVNAIIWNVPQIERQSHIWCLFQQTNDQYVKPIKVFYKDVQPQNEETTCDEHVGEVTLHLDEISIDTINIQEEDIQYVGAMFRQNLDKN